MYIDGDSSSWFKAFSGSECSARTRPETGESDVGSSLSKKPPTTVLLQPEPAPYVQLCYDEKQNTLSTILIGSQSKSNYAPLGEDYPDLRSFSSSSTEAWTTCSSSFSVEALTPEDDRPQEIVWLDRSWYFGNDMASRHMHRSLLLKEMDHEDEYSVMYASDDSCQSQGCGKFLRTCALRREKLPQSERYISEQQARRNLQPHRLLGGSYSTYMVLRG